MSEFSLANSKEHSKRFAHFSSLAYIAYKDRKIDAKALKLLKSFANKLGIDNHEYDMILASPEKYPIQKSSDSMKRLRRMFEMFQIIFADNIIDEAEREMIFQYAQEMGFSANYSKKIIDRSVTLFSGEFDFNTYVKYVED